MALRFVAILLMLSAFGQVTPVAAKSTDKIQQITPANSATLIATVEQMSYHAEDVKLLRRGWASLYQEGPSLQSGLAPDSFHALAVYNANSQTIIVAFSGTDILNVVDLIEDLEIGHETLVSVIYAPADADKISASMRREMTGRFPAVTSQLDGRISRSLNFYDKVMSLRPYLPGVKQVIVTGHSLGGFQAAVVGAVRHTMSVTFNAPAIPATLAKRYGVPLTGDPKSYDFARNLDVVSGADGINRLVGHKAVVPKLHQHVLDGTFDFLNGLPNPASAHFIQETKESVAFDTKRGLIRFPSDIVLPILHTSSHDQGGGDKRLSGEADNRSGSTQTSSDSGRANISDRDKGGGLQKSSTDSKDEGGISLAEGLVSLAFVHSSIKSESGSNAKKLLSQTVTIGRAKKNDSVGSGSGSSKSGSVNQDAGKTGESGDQKSGKKGGSPGSGGDNNSDGDKGQGVNAGMIFHTPRSGTLQDRIKRSTVEDTGRFSVTEKKADKTHSKSPSAGKGGMYTEDQWLLRETAWILDKEQKLLADYRRRHPPNVDPAPPALTGTLDGGSQLPSDNKLGVVLPPPNVDPFPPGFAEQFRAGGATIKFKLDNAPNVDPIEPGVVATPSAPSPSPVTPREITSFSPNSPSGALHGAASSSVSSMSRLPVPRLPDFRQPSEDASRDSYRHLSHTASGAEISCSVRRDSWLSHLDVRRTTLVVLFNGRELADANLAPLTKLPWKATKLSATFSSAEYGLSYHDTKDINPPFFVVYFDHQGTGWGENAVERLKQEKPRPVKLPYPIVGINSRLMEGKNVLNLGVDGRQFAGIVGQILAKRNFGDRIDKWTYAGPPLDKLDVTQARVVASLLKELPTVQKFTIDPGAYYLDRWPLDTLSSSHHGLIFAGTSSMAKDFWRRLSGKGGDGLLVYVGPRLFVVANGHDDLLVLKLNDIDLQIDSLSALLAHPKGTVSKEHYMPQDDIVDLAGSKTFWDARRFLYANLPNSNISELKNAFCDVTRPPPRPKHFDDSLLRRFYRIKWSHDQRWFAVDNSW